MKISIVIPVYNTPIQDIERCLNSIFSQTYDNWEAIIVDDGSSKNIALYLDSWTIKDKRFKVYHNINEGVSLARNYGIAMCTGTYISFCDADDKLRPYFFEQAVAFIQNYDLDMIIGSVCLIENGIHKEYRCSLNNNIPYIFGTSDKPIELLLDYMVSTHCKKTNSELGIIWTGRVISKICKADIIKKYRFQSDLWLHEDNLFSFDLISGCNRIGVVENIWYDVISNSYSATHQSVSINTVCQEIKFAHLFINKKGINEALDNAINIRVLLTIMNIFHYLLVDELVKERVVVINKVLNDNYIMSAINKCNFKGYVGFSAKIEFFKYIINCKLPINIKKRILNFILVTWSRLKG